MPPPQQSLMPKGFSSRLSCVIFLFAATVWCLLLFYLLSPAGNRSSSSSSGSSSGDLSSLQTRDQVILSSANEDPISIASETATAAAAAAYFTHKDFHSSLRPPQRYLQSQQRAAMAPMQEIEQNMTRYIRTLHNTFQAMAGPTVEPLSVWEQFVRITSDMSMQWDLDNRHRFPVPRHDDSIFVSLGTYRDPFCPMTIRSLYSNAKHPQKLFVGMFQQNCFGPKCRTGVLQGGKVEDAGPDVDCYIEFCASAEAQLTNACTNNQVRLFNVNESESLGPYMARYLGSKFYRGEQYYLQIDSHSEFVRNWDEKLIKMVETAPAEKPVISTYPPDSKMNWRDSVGFRMCDSEFASAQIEWQIVRLGSSLQFDKEVPSEPRYAPFVAAGFFFGPAQLLYEVPFDPFLPWIFMGEELSLSARLWTSGYDIFSPTTNVLNHYYVRRHYPKFWETVNRSFKRPIHNGLVEMIINRVKCMLGYPESHAELVFPNSVLHRLDQWGVGKQRSLAQYMQMVGLDPLRKQAAQNSWCHRGEWPEQALPYRLTAKQKKDLVAAQKKQQK